MQFSNFCLLNFLLVRPGCFKSYCSGHDFVQIPQWIKVKDMNIFALTSLKIDYITVFSITTIFFCVKNKLRFLIQD